MFLDISVKDLVNIKAQKITYNETIITRNDVIKMQKLMNYLADHRIHFSESIRLDSFILTQQNEIGLIFFEYYEYVIFNNGVMYLDKNKFLSSFVESELVTKILVDAIRRAPTDVENTISIDAFSTKNFNELVLNWFYSKYRNFRSVEKFIKSSETLFDTNLNSGYFNKITDKSEFLGVMFSRFVRTRKGSIPFSGEFGSTIKESLQTKSNYFTQKNILEEITDFTQTLTNIYNTDFSLVDIVYNEESDGIVTRVQITVTISIAQEEEIQFKLE
jgi:hypothetical protein